MRTTFIFTGKERDAESGLDYFGARYYASTMGRFSSPDPSGLMYADRENPQSFNLYSYVGNNPLKFIDPLGYYSCDPDTSSTSTDSEGNTSVTVTAGKCHFDASDFYQPHPQGSRTINSQAMPNLALASHAPNSVKSILKCASKTANQFSIAGVLGLTGEGGGLGSTIGTALLGNTFSGITDAGFHIANGQVGAAAQDYALGGYAQGLPFGSGLNAKGLGGVATDAAVNAVAPAGEVLSITGAAAPLAEEGLAGPVGLAKLAIDAAIFGASAAYCYAHP